MKKAKEAANKQIIIYEDEKRTQHNQKITEVILFIK
jgi:hypothetical protein